MLKTYYDLIISDLGPQGDIFFRALQDATRNEDKQIQQFFQKMGCFWRPMILHFAHWIAQNAHTPVKLNQRDSASLSLLRAQIPFMQSWTDVYLSRAICGLKDRQTLDENFDAYCDQQGLKSPFTLVDNGWYGTIDLFLKRHGLIFQSLYFLSMNRHIPCFLRSAPVQKVLNDLVPPKEQEAFIHAVNFSLEMIVPKDVKSPKTLVQQQGVFAPVLKPAEPVLLHLANSYAAGLLTATSEQKLSAVLQNFWQEYQKAKQGQLSFLCCGTDALTPERQTFLKAYDDFIEAQEKPVLRPATMADTQQILDLINFYADQGLMLKKCPYDIYKNIQSFTVYAQGDKILGCVRLAIAWHDLAEVASLAVAPSACKKGIGRLLVQHCANTARQLHIARLFTLTYQCDFFSKCGFWEIQRQDLPYKVFGDCLSCVKVDCCDEHAFIFDVSDKNDIPVLL